MGIIFNCKYHLSNFIIKRAGRFYIPLIFFVMFFTVLNTRVLTVNHASSFSIDYFDARPSIQIKGDYVNITYIAADRTEIKLVQAIIVYPDDNLETKSMTLDNDRYVYNHTYETTGKYTFHIVVEDMLGNKNETTSKTFWITADIDDIDNDGMLDWWEEKYGFDRFDSADAEEDMDGDGYTNVEEHNIGTNPLIKASLIQNMIYKLKENWKYFIVSFLFFLSIIILSLCGLFRRKRYEMDSK